VLVGRRLVKALAVVSQAIVSPEPTLEKARALMATLSNSKRAVVCGPMSKAYLAPRWVAVIIKLGHIITNGKASLEFVVHGVNSFYDACEV
jgi:hypothetical protein